MHGEEKKYKIGERKEKTNEVVVARSGLRGTIMLGEKERG